MRSNTCQQLSRRFVCFNTCQWLFQQFTHRNTCQQLSYRFACCNTSRWLSLWFVPSNTCQLLSQRFACHNTCQLLSQWFAHCNTCQRLSQQFTHHNFRRIVHCITHHFRSSTSIPSVYTPQCSSNTASDGVNFQHVGNMSEKPNI